MMMMMKSPVIILAFTLTFFSVTVLASQSSGPENCCFDYFPRRLPKSGIVSFRFTDQRCPKPAVLFKMKKGAEICAPPSQRWVQDIISPMSKAGRDSKAQTTD
ncbi:eotaxin-like [Genypterus blacodes]|uniref:eotaxin-like n=1 Tax=Genypterus blacodes TaxID=154954 RepID=UPI003F759B66